MKAAELPINVIIIVVLCLIVLLAIIALFMGVWTPGSGSMSLEGAKNNACQMLLSTGGCGIIDSTKSININNFDADKDGTLNEVGVGTDFTCGNKIKDAKDNLFMLCKCWYSITGANDAEIDSNCKTRVCGC